MLGLEPGAVPAHPGLWRELMHPDDLARVNPLFERVLAAGEKQYELEFRLRHREGRYVSVISRGYIQHDAAGKAVRVSGTNVDITPLRRAVDEAHAAQFWLEAAGRIARVGYWEIRFDDLRIMWSDITCDIHDEPRGFVPAFERAINYYPGEHRDAIARDVENLRLRGQSFLGEYQIVTATGRRIWVQSRGEPIRDRDDRIVGARGVFQDIDAQKRATEALLQSERNYREIFDATADAIFIHDEATGRILDVNAAMLRMYGFADKASALAFTVENLGRGKPPYGPDDARRHIQDALEKGPQVFEWRTRRADGSVFWVEVSLRRSEIGGQGRLLGCCRDISRRKALETRVREAEKMESLGRLAGGIAHDFNNMLGVIIGHTDLAEIRHGNHQSPQADLAQIRAAAQRSAALVRQLLTFARRQDISPAVIDLNRSVDAALSMLRRLIGENLVLDWQPGAGLWPVRIDPVQIDQILTNLAVNARDAISGSGTLTVRTANVSSDAGERVLLEFADTGAGMDAETLRHVFEPFFTTKAVGKGTGLGLATVYGIVEQNHGVIEVDSVPGRGTTFRISFPRVVSTVLSPRETSSHPIPLAGGDETILLVEDEPAILKLATIILELNGYTVVTASTPETALAWVSANETPLHLVVSDVLMPRINGGTLRERILMLRPGLKFLFISGYSGDALGGLDLAGPGIGFLHKPFSADALARKVRSLLDA
jgi:two-component system, cell cycle sensor histidine kinase and response regulator CckA